MTCKIKQIWDISKLGKYEQVLSKAGVRVRKTNSVFISGVGKVERVRIKLDRKNEFYLSDKIRDLHQVLKAIELSKNWNCSLGEIFFLMDKELKNPLEVHHNNNTLEYDVQVMTQKEHEQHHRQQILKEIRGN